MGSTRYQHVEEKKKKKMRGVLVQTLHSHLDYIFCKLQFPLPKIYGIFKRCSNCLHKLIVLVEIISLSFFNHTVLFVQDIILVRVYPCRQN